MLEVYGVKFFMKDKSPANPYPICSLNTCELLHHQRISISLANPATRQLRTLCSLNQVV